MQGPVDYNAMMQMLMMQPQPVADRGPTGPRGINAIAAPESGGVRPYGGGANPTGWRDGVKGGEWLGGRAMTPQDMTPQLMRQRIRQIEYDRRLSGHKVDGQYPPNGELFMLRKMLKESGG
jgi:hypothetical protein